MRGLYSCQPLGCECSYATAKGRSILLMDSLSAGSSEAQGCHPPSCPSTPSASNAAAVQCCVSVDRGSDGLLKEVGSIQNGFTT